MGVDRAGWLLVVQRDVGRAGDRGLFGHGLVDGVDHRGVRCGAGTGRCGAGTQGVATACGGRGVGRRRRG